MMPKRNDNWVLERFGEEDAAKLLPLIKLSQEVFYLSEAQLVAFNIQEMEKLASEDFKCKHPVDHLLAWRPSLLSR